MNGNDLPNNDLPVAERIAYLIAGFLRGTLTPAEHNELDAWVVTSEENTRLFENLTDESTIEAGLRWQQGLNENAAREKIRSRIAAPVTRKRFSAGWIVGIAASLLVLVVLGLFLMNGNSGRNTPPIASGDGAIHPGKEQAVLTLEDGRTIILDSAANGLMASEGGVRVIKGRGGEIVYQGEGEEVTLHTLSIPRGGQYRLVLSDGTKVWLNAETTLRFPASFGAGVRSVELQGEAYFEVAKDTKHPFRVAAQRRGGGKGQEVEVLGTHFNINGYGDFGGIRTTLLEGSVRVRHEDEAVVLKPGQQVTGSIGSLKVEEANGTMAVAWKDGLFRFQDATIQAIGAELGRWYNIEVETRGSVPDHFNATIERTEPLRDLLRILEDTHRVRFKLGGRKLIITP